MTGPEHYREAERLIAEAWEMASDPRTESLTSGRFAAAQVHATLALAAATALPTGGAGTASRGDWAMTTSGIADEWKPGMRNA